MAAAIELDPALADAEDVARALEVDPHRGLSTEDVKRRLQEYGPNDLRVKSPPTLLARTLTQLRDPLVMLLLVAAAVSLVSWVIEDAEALPVDAIVILAVVAFNIGIGLVHEARAAGAVASLAHMTSARSTVQRDGKLVVVPSSALVPGDVMHLAGGDLVGADARLLRCASLRLIEASLTGESTPVGKNSGTLRDVVPVGDRSNMVFRGTTVAGGTGCAIVTSIGMGTEIGAIATLLDETVEEPTPLQRDVARAGSLLGRIVVGIAVVIMLTIGVVERPASVSGWVTILMLGVSLAVAAVPEGLPAILSIVLALGVQHMARQNAVVKRLSSVETLGSATVICTDKTGTLTQNEMTICRVMTASGVAELTGIGYRPVGDALVAGRDRLLVDGHPDHLAEVRAVLGVGALANNAELSEHEGRWEIAGDPTEAAFLVAERKVPGLAARTRALSRRAEVPFSSERKLMSTVHLDHDRGRALLFTKGAPDVLVARCSQILVGSEPRPLDARRRAELLQSVDRLSASGLRTLAVAARLAPEVDPLDVDVVVGESAEHDMVYLGVVGMIDPPRSEAAVAIAQAHAAGVRVIMITGDHPETAARIAADLNIAPDGAHAVTGRELDVLGEQDLISIARHTSVFARVAPEHKLRIVDALQADGQIVAMTGDGVNDAPALKSADIGIAMGVTGAEVTKEAAKLILADDNFSTIVHAIHQGRVIIENVRKFLRYLLCSNVGEVLVMFFGVLFAGAIGLAQVGGDQMAVPLLAAQILWINLVTDTAPALAIGLDSETDDLMARPPRKSGDRLADRSMWVSIATTGAVLATATLLTIDLWLPGGIIPGGEESLQTARTAAFTTLVLGNLLAVFNARSARSSALHGLFVNWRLWGALALGAALQVAVVHLPPLQVAFESAPLGAEHWAVSALLASAVVVVEEFRKSLVRGRTIPLPDC